jgi:hypothetical protein
MVAQGLNRRAEKICDQHQGPPDNPLGRDGFLSLNVPCARSRPLYAVFVRGATTISV